MSGIFKIIHNIPFFYTIFYTIVVLCMATQLCYASEFSNEDLPASAKEKGKLVADDFLSRAKAPNAAGFNCFDARAYYGSCLYGSAVDK